MATCKQCWVEKEIFEDGLCSDCYARLKRTKTPGSGRTMHTLESVYHSQADVKKVRFSPKAEK